MYKNNHIEYLQLQAMGFIKLCELTKQIVEKIQNNSDLFTTEFDGYFNENDQEIFKKLDNLQKELNEIFKKIKDHEFKNKNVENAVNTLANIVVIPADNKHNVRIKETLAKLNECIDIFSLLIILR